MEEQQARMVELRNRVAALPGTTSVAFTTRLPVEPGGSSTTIIEGQTPSSGTGAVELPRASVSPDYFQTVGIRVTEGRAFDRDDTLSTVPVAVVNETTARRFCGEASPLGRRIRPQGSDEGWVQVVGVVADSKVSSRGELPSPMLYYPIGQSLSSGYLVVRTEGRPAALLSGLRAQLEAVSPDLPVSAIRDSGVAPRRLAGVTQAGCRLTGHVLVLGSAPGQSGHLCGLVTCCYATFGRVGNPDRPGRPWCGSGPHGHARHAGHSGRRTRRGRRIGAPPRVGARTRLVRGVHD